MAFLKGLQKYTILIKTTTTESQIFRLFDDP